MSLLLFFFPLQGVGNVVEASKVVGGVGRIVLVSSCLVTPANKFHPLRILLNITKWRLMDNKFEGEEALRKAGVSYTIIRPGGLTDKPQLRKLISGNVNQTPSLLNPFLIISVSHVINLHWYRRTYLYNSLESYMCRSRR